MILVDSSIWIDHLHRTEPELVSLLESDQVACHQAIIEELALGSISNRGEMLTMLANLRQLLPATHGETMKLIESRRLWGRGLSTVDVQLLAATLINSGTKIWTRDKRLHQIALELDVGL